MAYDLPAQPQLFGRLVTDAGIEGIVYCSRYSHEPCVAIFPQNFKGTDSYVALDDEPPPQNTVRRLDGATGLPPVIL